MVHAAADLAGAVRRGLAALADAELSPAMQRYMKSDLPFRGVPRPARATLLGSLAAEHPFDDVAVLDAAARTLWDGAEFREERYLATDLSGLPAFPRTTATVPLYRHWVLTGAWWDHVDEIAARRIGPILMTHRDEVTPAVRAWATHPDRWLRRTAVICQLGAKQQTDTDLLVAVIEANLGDPDFFLRKAIG